VEACVIASDLYDQIQRLTVYPRAPWEIYNIARLIIHWNLKRTRTVILRELL
jgi:hypothetical protein